MKALLVINEFLRTQKFEEIYDMLVVAFRKKGVKLEIKTNAEILPILSEAAQSYGQYRFAVFFDKDILLAEYLEHCGLKLFNSASAIAVCDDKRLTALRLRGKIKMPKTIISPMSYDNIGYTNNHFLDLVEQEIGFPMVVKEAFGSFGQQVYLIDNRLKLEECCKSSSTKLLFQEFIASSFGTDFRLQVVGDRVIAAMQRHGAKGSFISNISNGGTMHSVTAPKEFEDMAINACKSLGVDFGGVDIMIGSYGEPILCEINSNAHFKNLLDACSVNAADYIAEYIMKNYG